MCSDNKSFEAGWAGNELIPLLINEEQWQRHGGMKVHLPQIFSFAPEVFVFVRNFLAVS